MPPADDANDVAWMFYDDEVLSAVTRFDRFNRGHSAKDVSDGIANPGAWGRRPGSRRAPTPVEYCAKRSRQRSTASASGSTAPSPLTSSLSPYSSDSSVSVGRGRGAARNKRKEILSQGPDLLMGQAVEETLRDLNRPSLLVQPSRPPGRRPPPKSVFIDAEEESRDSGIGIGIAPPPRPPGSTRGEPEKKGKGKRGKTRWKKME